MTTKSTSELSLHDISLSYGKVPVLKDFSLTLPTRKTVGIVGPSGVGKSTLAKVAYLHLTPQRGHVSIDGNPILGVGNAVPVMTRRRISMVFQDPRASVDPRWILNDVIGEPLRLGPNPLKSKERQQRVLALVERVGLDTSMLSRQSHEVSGGQLQRVCIARALIQQPDWLICDEATSALDAATTASLVRLIQTLQAEHGFGVMAISHDRALLDVWADDVVEIKPLERV